MAKVQYGQNQGLSSGSSDEDFNQIEIPLQRDPCSSSTTRNTNSGRKRFASSHSKKNAQNYLRLQEAYSNLTTEPDEDDAVTDRAELHLSKWNQKLSCKEARQTYFKRYLPRAPFFIGIFKAFPSENAEIRKGYIVEVRHVAYM